MQRLLLLLALASMTISVAAQPVPTELNQGMLSAEETAPPPAAPSFNRFGVWVAGDLLAPFQSARPTHALVGAVALGAVATLSLADSSLSRFGQDRYTGTTASALDIANDLGDSRMLVASSLLWGGTLLTSNTRLQDAAFTSLEAGVYASVLTRVVKSATGRVRPRDGSAPYDFQPFSEHRSFPSGHTTLAFALTVPWAVYYPGPVTYGLVGVAGGTAVARIATGSHWPSDVLAGALVGGATGYLLARRHLGPSDGSSDSVSGAPPLAVYPFATAEARGLTLHLQF
ncbi:MAG: phosphatase PAP2 family protein [Rhodothermaceae bacterium]|nr:phosphatase PAP2 family protein [Rhodothermaceae bacterium]